VPAISIAFMAGTPKDHFTEEKKSSVFSLLKPYKGMVALLIVFALAGNGINLIIPRIISRTIDAYSAGHSDLRTPALEFLSAAFLIFLFSYLQSIVQTLASEKAAKDLRTKLSEKISAQSFSYIQQANPAKLLTNLTSDIDSVKMFISQAVVSIFSSLFVIVGASVLLMTINWRLALAVLGIIPVIGGAFFIMLRKVRVLFRKSREVIDWLNRVINESILGAAIIRVLNSQQQEYRKFIDANSTSRDLGLSILSMFAALIPVISFVSNLALLTILVLGGHFVISGSMSLGNLAAFNSYISILIFPILVIGFMSNLIAMATASYQRISLVLDAPVPPESGTKQQQLTGQIHVKEVTVTYGEKPALRNVSIEIPAGSRTSIIGPTAAGKTQLLYLLTGLIQPVSGSVRYDDVPLAEIEKASFYRQVGLVFQDSVLFNLSLRENIAFNESVTAESLDRAIETAELKNFISSLPDALETIVSERGTSLSGGQKQRIMLARALALNPKILLLDDFTARVDKRTERRIISNVIRNYPGITVVSVTQKISSAEQDDQIILMMEGEVLARGTHNELLRTSPEYVQIYNSQRSTSHYDLQS
jgi:ATP-binding cassette, subfamily B, bacterial